MSATVRIRHRVIALAVMVVVAGATLVGTAVAASAQTAPTVATTTATGVTTIQATLNGNVNPNSLPTTYYFEYGTTTSYGLITASLSAGSGSTSLPVATIVTGLAPNTTYYFQLVATNADGVINGGSVAFFTSSASTFFSENRVAGSDRYQTSAMIAEAKYPGGVPSGNVLVATGADFPDALAGNYLAGQLQAPILLTPGSVLDPAFPTVLSALTALNATHVYILGGTAAVGSDVETALAAKYTVVRIAGNTRFDTMQLIDTQPGYVPNNGTSGARTAIIATGDNFPDALAGGPLAWAEKFPLILTDGTQATLSPEAVTVIQTLGITHFLVLGGPQTINPAQLTLLASLGVVDSQFAGADRTDTAAQFAGYEQSVYSFGKSTAILATGQNFPDALSAGPWGGDTQSIYFTEDEDTLGAYTTTALTNLAGQVSVLNIAGGLNAVDANAAAAAQTVLQGSTNSSLAPTVVTGAANVTSSTSATLNGTVNPNGYSTTYYFQYGLTSSLGVSSTTQTLVASTGSQAVSTSILGLASGSTYYYRIVATNQYGTNYGAVQSFVVTSLHLQVSVPGGSTAGSSFSITVTALSGSSTVTSYTGTVQFGSTDPGATLPATYTFVAGDNGVHTFSGVTLVKAGSQTITATDTVTPSITGTSPVITVTPASATTLQVSAPGAATHGMAFSVTVTALDQFGNTATGYTGTVHFTSSDGAVGVILPGDYTFTGGDAGVHTFSSGVTLVTTGGQTVTATDKNTGSIHGTSGTITVS